MTHSIPIRKLVFAFSGDRDPVWHPREVEWSHMINGASLTMPYLEPFLVKNIREAIPHLKDKELIEDAKGFVGQEAQHFTNHRRYNEMLKRNGHPQLADVEQTFTKGYSKLAKRSLAWRLAYTAGFETMTMGITEWLVNDRDALFHGADPEVTSFVLWHMVEETEHKSVAFDVFQAVSGHYGLRIFGLLYGSLHVGFLSRRGYMRMLKTDGHWYHLPSRLRLWRQVLRFYAKAGRAMLRALHPKHHPDETEDPAWIHQWQQANADLRGDQLPLLDTQKAGIPPNKEAA